MTEPDGSPSMDERFLRYHATHDRALRDELVVTYLDLARALARRYRGRGESIDDLEQVALLGLVKAVERFDPGHGSAFETFAAPTILGELKRHFRDTTWSVRMPRALQELALELNRALADLAQGLGRSPTVAELAHHTGHTEEDVLEAMEAGRAFNAVSLDTPEPGAADEGGPALAERLGAEDAGVSAAEAGIAVAALLDTLPHRERRIMRLRFYGGLTQSEIATRLGISQMQVSRLLSRSLGVLRGQLYR